MSRRILTLTACLLAVGAGMAVAGDASTTSNGSPPVTVQAHGYPCSVTAYGPTFRWHPLTQTYGGGTSCAGGVGTKALTISVQVLGQDGRTWYTITGSTFTAGPIAGNPLRTNGKRAAYLGHVYRTVATARLVVPNGHAGCSLNNTCSQTITITAISKPVAP